MQEYKSPLSSHRSFLNTRHSPVMKVLSKCRFSNEIFRAQRTNDFKNDRCTLGTCSAPKYFIFKKFSHPFCFYN